MTADADDATGGETDPTDGGGARAPQRNVRQGGRAAGADGYRGPVPAPLPPAGRGRWTFIDRPEQVLRVAATVGAADVLAVDAEFVQTRDRGPDDPPHRLALLQLASSPATEGTYVLDPLRLADLVPLEAPFNDGRVLKLFHGIGADARVLATRGLIARHTLDLEAVSRSVFGQRESSLQSMLARACGVRLDKSLQRSDWTRRPLTTAMMAYAARDAEMTLVLYTWLSTHYPWAVALHEVPADDPVPAVADWVLPFLDGARPQRAEWAVAAAGLDGNVAAQVAALREALGALRRAPQRARLIRLIADLDLRALSPELLPLLDAPAADERATATRALGRLRYTAAEPALIRLLGDPVQDVREAAQAALDHIRGAEAPPRQTSRVRRETPGAWTVGGADDDIAPATEWQAALRARFRTGQPEEQTTPDADAPAEDLDYGRGEPRR